MRRIDLVGLQRRRAEPLPDRAVGRHEAAHGHGHLDAPRPFAADRRRDHLGPRRVDSAGRRRDSRQLPRPRLRQEHDRDHPRRLDPVPDRGLDPDHVRGQAGREGRHRASSSRSPYTRTRGCSFRRSRRSGFATRTRSWPEFRAAHRRSWTLRRVAASGRAARWPSPSARKSRRSWNSSATTGSPAGRPPDQMLSLDRVSKIYKVGTFGGKDLRRRPRRQLRREARRSRLADRRERQRQDDRRQDDPEADRDQPRHHHARRRGRLPAARRRPSRRTTATSRAYSRIRSARTTRSSKPTASSP